MAASKYEFVKEPDADLTCSICLHVAEEPKQENKCGKLFCTKCLEEYGEEKSCPHCRTTHPEYFKDKKSDREIQLSTVKCAHSKKGCPWTGSLKNIENHVTKSCDFTMVTCKYEDIGCTKNGLRKHVREHEEDASTHLTLCLDAVKIMREAMHVADGDGITIHLPEYQAKKRLDECYCSKPFYTHMKGYKMMFIVLSNGYHDGENTHVSVAIKLLEGSYDHSLSWPFVGTITVSLLNQLEDDYHHCISKDIDADDNVTTSSVVYPFGKSKFILHSILEDDDDDVYIYDAESVQYMLNDTLYFRVTVETDEHKPWLTYDLSLEAQPPKSP